MKSFVPAPPFSWWTADKIVVAMDTGPSFFYVVGPRRPIRDQEGRWVRDSTGRMALEAFGALPLADMYRRLREGSEAWIASGDEAARSAIIAADPERESRRWREDLDPLVRFVEQFGPLGFDWSRTRWVANPEADRALDEIDRRRIADVVRAAGGSVDAVRLESKRRAWQVIERGPGFSIPKVSQAYVYPDLSWPERVLRGDVALDHDYLGLEPTGPLWNHQDDLRRALNLVKALGAAKPNRFDIRDAAGNMPGFGEYSVRDHGDRDPVDVRWRDAMVQPRDLGGRLWAPFREHETAVKWVAAGRMMLAEFLSKQLAGTKIEVGLDEAGDYRTRWTPGSLLEIIYLQLLEHVEERLEFGVGDCPNCGGPILMTRRSPRTRNRGHHGCAAVLRKRRQREKARQGVTQDEPS
jgi:hypothetical protein